MNESYIVLESGNTLTTTQDHKQMILNTGGCTINLSRECSEDKKWGIFQEEWNNKIFDIGYAVYKECPIHHKETNDHGNCPVTNCSMFF